eukprot:1927662-Pyramimonas_sp.AAC.1
MYKTPLEQVQLSPFGGEDHADIVNRLQKELADYFGARAPRRDWLRRRRPRQAGSRVPRGISLG